MTIVKLSATDSTNTYLKQLSVAQCIDDFTVVIADKQTLGRGQMGAVWDSESSKNVTCSVYKRFSTLNLECNFYISMVTSLAILKTLNSFLVPRVSIKWPNDILSVEKKICGVLIENLITKQNIKASIIGIGLNVNQTKFDNLPKASSLKLILGNDFNLDQVVVTLVNNLKLYFLLLEERKYAAIKAEYEAHLFRKDKPSTFKNSNGIMFSGFIKGVSDSGQLIVLLEDDIIKFFNLKEITLLY